MTIRTPLSRTGIETPGGSVGGVGHRLQVWRSIRRAFRQGCHPLIAP